VNLVEKILARASGRESVEPGEIVVAKVDRLIMHDLSGYLTSQVYEKRVNAPIPDPERAVLVFDHHFAPPTEQQAEVLRHNREWARKHGLTLYDCGNGNLHHAVVRKGHIKPGMIVVGSDSHTPVHGTLGALAVALGNDSHAGTVLPYGTAWFKVPETTRVHLEGTPKPGVTPRDVALWLVGRIGEGELNYRAVEFGGPYVRGLSFWDRWLFPLLCVDLGAKCSFVEPDEVTEAFVRTLPGDGPDLLVRGDGEEAAQVLRFDVGEVDPRARRSSTPSSAATAAADWRTSARRPVCWPGTGFTRTCGSTSCRPAARCSRRRRGKGSCSRCTRRVRRGSRRARAPTRRTTWARWPRTRR
jgi:3-isopropylmalate/(R)-2-methylmalate dehydratase large subunit